MGEGKCCDHCLCKCNNYLLGPLPVSGASSHYPPSAFSYRSPPPRSYSPGPTLGNQSLSAPGALYSPTRNIFSRRLLGSSLDPSPLAPLQTTSRSPLSNRLFDTINGSLRSSLNSSSSDSDSDTLGRNKRSKKSAAGSPAGGKSKRASKSTSKSRGKNSKTAANQTTPLAAAPGAPQVSSILPPLTTSTSTATATSSASSDLMMNELHLLRQKVQVCELRSAIMDEKLRDLNGRMVPKERLQELRVAILNSINGAFDQVMRENHAL